MTEGFWDKELWSLRAAPAGASCYPHERGCWIVNDYDSEFRCERHSIASPQGPDKANRFLYTDTLRKALLPSLRSAISSFRSI